MSDTIILIDIKQYIDGSISIEFQSKNAVIGKGYYGLTTKKQVIQHLRKMLKNKKDIKEV